MARALSLALAFMMASAVVQANQYSSGGGCPSNNESQNAVFLLQTNLQMNVPKNGGKMLRCMAAARTRPLYAGTPAEDEWLKGAKGQICEIAARPSQTEAASRWIQYSSRAFTSNATFVPPDAEEDGALSHFVIGDRKEAIEPIHGYLRHPFANVGCNQGEPADGSATSHGTDIFDISYLIISNKCGIKEAAEAKECHQRNVFFDLGVSVGFKGISGGIPKASSLRASGGGPSLPLFLSMYRDHCIKFDDIFAWEVSDQDQQEWWGELSPDLRSRVRFYNVPVAETFGKDGLPKMQPNSFLQLLKASVKPEDFVAIKIDIDTPDLENPIVTAIAENPEYSQLVDEIFYEYHVYMDGKGPLGWKKQGITSPSGPNVDNALLMFKKLREQGIRSHFWI